MKIVILTVLFGLALFVLFPIMIIWAINTLFPALSIPYTLETWAAASILCSVFGTEWFVRNSKRG